MSVKVTFDFEDAAAAAAFLLRVDGEPTEVAAALNGDGPKRGRGRPRKEDAVPVQAAAETVVAAAPPAAAVPEYSKVADAISALAEVDYDAAIALLKEHGAPTAKALKPESFQAVIDAATAAIAKLKQPAARQSLI